MLDALTLNQLRVFVAVAEAGSFRAAATRLTRVQSAVSHAIENLETQLGTCLFDRSGLRPTLTLEGRSLLADARAILLKVDAMRARARGLGEGAELSLQIVVDALFPFARMSAALGAVRAAYPELSLTLAVLPLGGPIDALLRGNASIGILCGEDFRDPRVELEALAPVEIVAVVAPEHPLSTVPCSVRALELADHLQIVLGDPTVLSDGRDFGVLSPRTWRVGTQEVKHALIRDGHGWGRLPTWLVADDLAAGRLRRLDATALGPAGAEITQAYLARRIDVPAGPVARELRKALLPALACSM